MTKRQEIQLFEEKKVRSVWDSETEKWYFSVVDGRANEDMMKRLLDNWGVAKSADTDFPV